MAYTAIDDPEAYFQVKLYAGDSTNHALTLDGDTDMQPDLVWIKERDAAIQHYIYDSVRGVGKRLLPAETNAESDTDSTWFASFDSDGFSIGSEDNINDTGDNYVAWCWKAGTAFSNDASATSVGTIDSVGSVSADAGFSILTWTSTAAAHTVAHGISTPAVIIMKGRHEANSWQVYHHKNTTAPETDYLDLSTADATADYTVWNDTAPTSSVMSLGTWSGLDDGGTMVAYIFAEKQGYSKFGSYTGNGNADGTFVYTGFRPAWILCKSTAATTWEMVDNKRVGYNSSNWNLFPNTAAVENVDTVRLDILSNGFKIRTTGSNLNTSGQTYLYMAFAEAPLVNSNGVPNNAR